MRHSMRTLVLLVILLAIMSSLYVFNRLSEPSVEISEITPSIPFDGKVPPEIARGSSAKNEVIFTFDAGSGISSVVPILETLKKHGVKGTFFMTGKWVLQNPELTRRILAEGHEVFNHTFNHPYLTQVTDTEIANQFNEMDAALMEIAGTSTKPYFRPPYGDRDARVLKIAAANGYQSVYWSADAGDWMESEGKTADEVKSTIYSNLYPGAIFLMHVGDTITGSILDELLTTVEQRGYKAVSLTQGL